MSEKNPTVLGNPKLQQLDKEVRRLDEKIGENVNKAREYYGQLVYTLSKYYEACDCNKDRYYALVKLKHLEDRSQQQVKRAGMIAHQYGLTDRAGAAKKEIPISIKGLLELPKLFEEPKNAAERQPIVRKIERRITDAKPYLDVSDIKAIPVPPDRDVKEALTLSQGVKQMIRDLENVFSGVRGEKLNEIIKYKDHLSIEQQDQLVDKLSDVIQSAEEFRSRLR